MSQPLTSEAAGKPQTPTAAHPVTPALPSPARIFQTLIAFQQSAALKAAIDLDVFTIIADRQTTVEQIAERAGAAERGIRILCDYLAVQGFLTKAESGYGLAPDAAIFLDRRSPAYMGSAARFLVLPVTLSEFEHLTEAVRKGGTANGQGTLTADNPVWVEFAKAMAPMMMMPAEVLCNVVDARKPGKCRVLDLAAGHGLFGINIARYNPEAEIVALDWPSVLQVAKENAREAGVDSRYSTIPGSAFEVDFGEGYDLVLLTNFLHHFGPSSCEQVVRKVHSALAPGGRAVTLEFVPNEDRVSPPEAASFSMIMLSSTPHGEAYTFAELERMFKNAGFSHSEHFRQPPLPESVIISYR